MELTTGASHTVYLDGAADWTVTATWQKNDEMPVSLPVVNGEPHSAVLPYFIDECRVTVTWNITLTGQGAVVKKDIYEIVTPYLSNREVLNIIKGGTDEDALAAEASVRHIINSHTGQSFGTFVGEKLVYAEGKNYISLPARLVTLTSLNGVDIGGSGIRVDGGGWYISAPDYGSYAPSVRADFDGYNEATVPIQAPGRNRNGYFTAGPFIVDGVWGYEYVPEPVREAAKLLTNDYHCDDGVYRDRYLKTMTAADWRIEFVSGAYLKTGNVRADQLLSRFVLNRGMAVL